MKPARMTPALAFAALAALLVGCGPKEEPTAVGFKDNNRPALMAGDKTKVIVPHPVTEDMPPELKDKPAPAQTAKKDPVPAPATGFKPGKPDPAVFGDYKIEVNDETKRMLDNGIRKLREEGAKGDPQAATALEYAEAAQKAAEEMSIQLREDGKFFADFVTGKSFGQYQMGGNNVRLLPSDVLTDSGSPKSFDLTFDKAANKLSLNLQGSTLTFVKVKKPRAS